jgi:hypothetical protein
MVPFLIEWLLCTVAFVIAGPGPEPVTTVGVLKCAAAGALVAIAIAFVPGLVARGG